MAYMCMCISLTNATTYRDDIQIDTVKAQILVIRKIRLYPAEGHMPRASEAPFTLVDIVRCSKLWTAVDVGRYSQCSPTNGHRKEDALLLHKQSSGRRRSWMSSRGSLPKNLIATHPVQDSQADVGSGGTCSPTPPCT